MRCVSRDIRLARSALYDVPMIFHDGNLPIVYAGKRRDASSDLPERGGAAISNRGDLPAATSKRNWSSSAHSSSLNQPVSYVGFV